MCFIFQFVLQNIVLAKVTNLCETLHQWFAIFWESGHLSSMVLNVVASLVENHWYTFSVILNEVPLLLPGKSSLHGLCTARLGMAVACAHSLVSLDFSNKPKAGRRAILCCCCCHLPTHPNTLPGNREAPRTVLPILSRPPGYSYFIAWGLYHLSASIFKPE